VNPRFPASVKKKKAVTGSAPGSIRGFKTRKEFAAWLEKNHETTPALWIRIARKGSEIKSITYAEGVEVALCYGWIDAQKLPETGTTWLQRFMPRRPRSIWSKVNREKALALIANGQMTQSGLAEIERAKKDGRWEAAYDSQAGASVPLDFEKELERHPKAKEFFKSISAANRYAITWRLQTAKRAGTRAKRMRTFIEMLEKGETLH
jgi:uncharacterized protein YdeI (YjbR/CyaY-like superfamily)